MLRKGNARYLSNDLIRFTSVDPGASLDPFNPQSWNRYAYSLNNPEMFIDPDGEDAADIYNWFVEGAVQLKASSSTSGNVGLDFLGNTVADIGVGLVSPLNIGSATGNAIAEYGGVGDADAKWRIAAAAAGDAGNAILTGVALYSAVKPGPTVTEAYKRPSNATTAEQRAAVQGKPCVDCGQVEPKMVANHKRPLVKEHYETGKVDLKKMRDVKSVNSQCPSCSARQGGKLSKYSKEQRAKYNLQ